MRKILVIAWNDLRIFFQSPTNLVQVTVIPLAFAFVMGLAFGGAEAGSTTLLLDVIDVDNSAASAILVEALAGANPNVLVCPANEDDEDRCQLGDVTVDAFTAELAQQRLEDGVTAALLTVPAGYADALGSDGEIELVFQSDADLTGPQVVLRTVESVVTRVGGATVAARLSTATAESLGVVADDETRAVYYDARYAEAELAWGPPPPVQIVSQATLQAEDEGDAGGFGQSASGMAAMFVMMNVLGLAQALVQERIDGTLPRLIVMPVSRTQLLGGKILRGYVLGLFTFTLMVVFATFLGVNFGNNVLAVILIMLAYTLAVTAMSLALATLVRTPDQAGGISLMATMVLAPLGGAWWPLDIVPEFMATVGHISPIAWCMDAFNSLIFFGGGLSDILFPVLVLLGFAAVFFAFGISRFKYE